MSDQPGESAVQSLVTVLEQSKDFQILKAQHPIQARLMRAAVVRVDGIREPVAHQRPLSEWLSEFTRFSDELGEILSWLFDESHRRRTPDAVNEDCWKFLNAGYSPTVAMAHARAVNTRRRGRPVQKRRLAVDALELRLAGPTWSWWKIADKLCKCGKHPHCIADSDCWQAIRQQVRVLKKFLKEYEV